MTRVYLPISDLYPHEEIEPANLERTVEAMRQGELLENHPILVDRETGVILDGHHRYAACKVLGIILIPCILVDYHSEVLLESRRPEVPVSKAEVIRRGLSGELYPPKSTRHIYRKARPSQAP